MSKSDVRKRTRTSTDDSDDDSDSDHRTNRKIYADGYDENYRGDANDRAWLKTLSEREREAELLKRHEQREIMKRREEINKRLKSKAEESGAKSEEEGEIDEDDEDIPTRSMTTTTTTSGALSNDIYAEDDEDDDYRSSTNRRKQINASKQKETEHSKSLQLLVEGRKKKQEEKHRKTLIKADDLSSSDDDAVGESAPKSRGKDEIWKVDDVFETSSSDADDDDDRSRSGHRRLRSRSPDDGSSDSREVESRRKMSTPINNRDQLKAMILSRYRMEKWCHSPFFADVAKGAFVRINIGQNNGEPVYRVCEIRDVVETPKIYNLGATRTNKGLRLKHANNERIFRLEYVSNNEISETEFQRWKEAMLKQGIGLPTLSDLENKTKTIEKFKHYKYNDKDITKMVEEKKRFRKAPVNYAMSKTELLSEIANAKDENDLEREQELRKRLTEIEERANELDRRRNERVSIMAEINRRNRQNTQKNIELALVREAQELRNKPADPFTRHRCAPTLVTQAPQVNTKDDLLKSLEQERREAEAAAQKKKLEEQKHTAEKPKPSSSTISATVSETSLSAMTTSERGSFTSFSDQHDEMFTSHDFEIDLVI